MELTIRIIEAAAHAAETEAAAEAQGVLRIANDADPLELPLDGVRCIELHFPKFTDGRAFSQAFLLRRRRGFAGDIRATGDVLIDQLVQMQRSGFSSAVLKDGKDPADADRQFARYPRYYQGDAVAPQPLFREAA
ncbi:MAG: DUF934 domain-containing protein [Pseudomonadota bacterium]